MSKIYRYNKFNIVNYFGLLLVPFACMPIIVLYLMGIPKDSDMTSIALELFMISMMTLPALITFAYIVNWLSVEVILDESGITYNSKFSKFVAPWEEIVSVKRKHIYTGSFCSDMRKKDLQFQLKNKQKFEVLHFLDSTHNKNLQLDGMPEFEGDIMRYLGDVIEDK